MNNEQRGQEALAELDKALKSRDRSEKSRPLGVIFVALVAILAIVGAIFYLATRDNSSDTDDASADSDTPQPLSLVRDQALPETVNCDYPADGKAAREAKAPAGDKVSARGTVHLTLATNQGEIPMDLDRSLAPCTVHAMESLAKAKYFDNTVCHRITDPSMSNGMGILQCGDPAGTGAGGPGFRFANEYPTDEAANKDNPVIYPRGSVAMANAGEGTNGSQMFLNFTDTTLPPAYTAFGQITDTGLKTLDPIAANGVKDPAPDGAPAKEVRITSATVS
ncbi:peptidylprolyl isomerase [Corynebacterium sp. Marseille-Q2516]